MFAVSLIHSVCLFSSFLLFVFSCFYLRTFAAFIFNKIIVSCRIAVPAQIADSEHTSNVDVLLNESIKLHCAAGGLPRPRVVWYFDDSPLMAEHNGTRGVYVLDDGWALLIDGAQLRHAGKYLCRAVNDAGDARKHFNVTVLGQSPTCCSVCIALNSKMESKLFFEPHGLTRQR